MTEHASRKGRRAGRTDFVPKPVLTLAVGVTGHRARRLGAEHIEPIRVQLGEVFARIGEAARHEAEARPDRYAAAPPEIRLLSSLADGSDQTALLAAPPGWAGTAILPLPLAAYREKLLQNRTPEEGEAIEAGLDRALAASRSTIVLPDDPPPRAGTASADDELIRAARLMVRQCDILVAVWDGGPVDLAGGTADVVARALEAKIPVVWIAPEADRPPWLIERLPVPGAETAHADARDQQIAEAVAAILAVPEPARSVEAEEHADDPGAPDRLARFLAEPRRRRSAATAYRLLTSFPKIWRWRPWIGLPDAGDIRADWRGFLETSADRDFAARIEAVLAPRFAAADALATSFAHAYRSAYVLAYGLSILAVGIALYGLLPHHVDSVTGQIDHKAKLVVAELVVVALIVLIVWAGRHGHGHQRWLDYRALAEMLRHLRFLGLMGQYEPRALAQAAAPPGRGWILWYLRATTRELGMPSGTLDGTFQRRVLKAVETHEIDRQIAYHGGNEEALSHLDHKLHRIGLLAFGLTIAVLAGFLVLWGYDWLARPSRLGWPHEALAAILGASVPYVAFAASLLPALGAAAAGIRFTGDFEGFAIRSAETKLALEELKLRYAGAYEELAFDTTAAAMTETAHVLAADITGWRSLYGRKELTLPG